VGLREDVALCLSQEPVGLGEVEQEQNFIAEEEAHY